MTLEKKHSAKRWAFVVVFIWHASYANFSLTLSFMSIYAKLHPLLIIII